MRKILLCSIFFAAIATSTLANNPEITNIAVLSGKCEKLVMRGKDLTIGCSDYIMQEVYNFGRINFIMLIGQDGARAIFSGFDGAKPDANTQIQDLDQIIFDLNIPGVKSNLIKASGTCVYSNPYLGPMTIMCQAVDEKNGAYALEFRTDGRDPIFISQ